MNCGKASYQSIFNKVVNHLRTQGCKAVDGTYCRYRIKKTNLKCAIGCLIPNDKYKPSMEGESIDSKLIANALRMKNSLSRKNEFLQNLQYIHDFSPIKNWELEFINFTKQYKLDYIKPKEK